MKNKRNYQKINFFKFLMMLPFLAIIISMLNIIFIDDIYLKLIIFCVSTILLFIMANTNVNPPFRGVKIMGLALDGRWIVWRTRNILLLSVQTITAIFLAESTLYYSPRLFLLILGVCILLAILLYQRGYNYNLDKIVANFTVGMIVYRVFTTEMMWIPIVALLIFIIGIWVCFKKESKKY